MKIQHQVTILNRPSAYTARIDDGKVHLTVPHIVFRDDLAHLTSRHDVIDDLPMVLQIYEHIDDHEPIEAWRLIGRVIGDTYGTCSLTATGYNAIGRPFYADLIKEEASKLNSLKRRVAICEQIIASLRGAESTAPIARSRDVIAPVVLAYLGKKGKTMDELSEYMKSSG